MFLGVKCIASLSFHVFAPLTASVPSFLLLVLSSHLLAILGVFSVDSVRCGVSPCDSSG